ncbi:MAG TPA: PA4642 family protein [Cellvibrionaceae bacterium]|nr:PA4642 family protein [Cellvibrionaceae bacterium]
MSEKKDKKKILVETFSDERVKGFLNGTPPAGVSEDYYLLERAYRGMNEENFATFIRFFVEADKDLNAKNPQGLTIAQVIAQHRNGGEYLDALKGAGAK